MPIYEFYCPQNNTLYQFLARSLSYREAIPLCPDNPDFVLEKRVSQFAVIGRAKEETPEDPFSELGEAGMDKLMAEMESDMSLLEDDNPDPRKLGSFMRKLTDAMGGKVTPELQEVVRRLEAGEDPEKLEKHFSDSDEFNADSDPLFARVKKIIRSARQPVRDPKLYELSEWLRP